MRILSVLTCCFGLALFAGAAQQAVTPPPTGKMYKAGPGGGHHNANFQQPSTVTNYNKPTGKNAKNWQGPVTGGNQTNVSGNAASTKFNKGKFSSQTNV